jgi:hypothetical protein
METPIRPFSGAENAAQPATTPIVRPEWIRLPKDGQSCPHSGLTRSFLANLVRQGLVPSKALRRRGASRGVRLISYDGLMAFIAKTEEGSN